MLFQRSDKKGCSAFRLTSILFFIAVFAFSPTGWTQQLGLISGLVYLMGNGGMGELTGQTQQAAGRAAQASGVAKALQLPLFKSRIINVARPVGRVSVGNPDIADILVIDPKQVYIVGKSLGTTNVVMWDEQDKVITVIDLEIIHDLATLKQKLHELLLHEDIQVRSSGDMIALSGEVSSPLKMDAAMRLAASFSPGEGRVLNLMQVGGAQQVMLEVKVAEVNREITKRLNIDFHAVDPLSRWTIGAVSGGASFPDLSPRVPIFTDSNPFGPAIDEFVPNPLGIADKGFFASFLSGTFLFNAVLDAAKNNGLAKILAEPTLTTMTGQQAQFLSGGEFPIPVPSEDGTTTVEFKDFGVGLSFLPVVLDSGRINLKVEINVTELSDAASIVVGVQGTQTEFAVPSLTTRRSTSTLELSDGQTMAIAGLINDTFREQVTRFPGLGDVPVLGALFRSQEFVKGQSELVIFVTPRFARPTPPELVRLPTDSFVEPNDVEFYLLGRMEAGPRSERSEEPRGPLQQGGLEGEFGHQL